MTTRARSIGASVSLEHPAVTAFVLLGVATVSFISMNLLLPSSAPDGATEPAIVISEDHFLATDAATRALAMSNAEISKLPANDIAAAGKKFWDSPRIDPERRRAVTVFEMAYARGERQQSAFHLGFARMFGVGADKNLEAALRYFSDGALKDLGYARFYAGQILADAAFGGRDDAMARNEFAAAKRLGVAEAGAALSKLTATRLFDHNSRDQ